MTYNNLSKASQAYRTVYTENVLEGPIDSIMDKNDAITEALASQFATVAMPVETQCTYNN